MEIIIITQNIQFDKINHSEDFDLVLGTDAITDLGIIINRKNKTLEWNGNIFPLEEISDVWFQCHYNDIGRSSLYFTEDINMELNHKYKYKHENNNGINQRDMGGTYKAENYYFFSSESSVNDYNLKGNNSYENINSSHSKIYSKWN